MNPFLKKEVRLVLPSWLVVMGLAVLSPWLFWGERDTTPVFVFFGMILLAVDCFGREFSLGTFTSLMAQPMARGKIWRTKITLLCVATGLVYLAYFLSCVVLVLLSRAISGPIISNIMMKQSLVNVIPNVAVALVVALTGGLWTTILLRQVSAAFWITFLAPLGLLTGLTFILPATFQASHYYPVLLYSLTVIYCVAGFWLARRMFYESQDVAWTGGVIAFSRWRYFEAGSGTGVTVRRFKPWWTLFKKEFQLQSISLFCVGALLVLHIGVLLMRGFYGDHFEPNSMAGTISDFFWVFWLVLPLVIGCMAVAEERKLGVMESQFCLPVSPRAQFLIKFIPALIAGILLGAGMPLLLEYLANRFGVPNHYFNSDSFLGINYLSGFDLFLVSSFLGVIGLVLAGFLASTLARHFMQALSIAIVLLVAFFIFNGFLTDNRQLGGGELIRAGRAWWGGVLPVFIGLPTIFLVVSWLSYRNFRYFAETNRLWRRNGVGMLGALVFVFGASALAYNRAWEVFEPAEPAHGPAKLSLSNPPAFKPGMSDGINLQLPDGRFWFDGMVDENFQDRQNRWQEFVGTIRRPLPVSVGPAQFLDGSNWVSVTPIRYVGSWYGPADLQGFRGFRETVGIKSDGTLWVSSDNQPSGWSGGVQSDGTLRLVYDANMVPWGGNKMIQVGNETNWRQVVADFDHGLLLLKTDGTLWEWREGMPGRPGIAGPGMRNYQPKQVGTDSDWQRIFANWVYYAQKMDGSLWAAGRLEVETNGLQFTPAPNLNPARIANSHWFGTGYAAWSEAYIETNGTLRVANRYLDPKDKIWVMKGYLQVGRDTNWVDVAFAGPDLVGLKQDGSLWSWHWPSFNANTAEVIKSPATRFSAHNDWVGIVSAGGGIYTLAADGSLMFWPTPADYVQGRDMGVLIKTDQRPKLIANIFSANN